MRIAIVSPSFLPQVGGAEFVAHHLATQWCRQGHEVCVLNCLTAERAAPDACYTVRRFGLLRGCTWAGHHRFPFRWWAVRGIERLLDEFRPDLVSAHMAFPTGVWMASLKTPPPFLVTCHGGDITPFQWGYRARYGIDGILRESLEKSLGVVAISRHARRLLEEMGVSPDRILDIPNGVELDRFRRRVDFDLRKRFGLPQDAFVVISVGRDHPAKDYGTAIRAMAIVAGHVPEVQYLLVGRETEKWRGLIAELGLDGRVVACEGLYGDELVGAYQQADVFLSCSVQEMFPLVILEAMAAGLPAVVTNVSGNQDAVEDGRNGLLVEPGRPDEIARAVERLARDIQLRRSMAREGSAMVEDYSWERISRRYLEGAARRAQASSGALATPDTSLL